MSDNYVPYGQGFDLQHALFEGDYEVSTLAMRLPNQGIKFYYNLRMGGSMVNGQVCDSRDKAIADGLEEARRRTAENRARYQKTIRGL